ncbi:T9SS sorting signal type C domain-containing protein [Flavobacterium sp. PL002]|uniref:Ig-like domain-containing protein n=1 Tax=Flavobacterium sp. PL002 TaxID=1897058 RepID=UPI001787FE43|nr:T9SS sorting signal type C domain-containing protein [Flavobacterium sp. PL002]MBE0390362.1 hypothetical protein [Flavobacterium sp. PL002]
MKIIIETPRSMIRNFTFKASVFFKYRAIILFLIFVNAYSVSAQCAFPSGTTSPRETITFCIDNSNTRVTANDLTAGQYVAVNVVKGFNYTFTFPELFGGNENLTIFNAVNTATAVAFVTSTTSADAVINWTATFSGQIYVLVSRGNCNNDPSGRNSKMTIRLNTVGNTQDSQTTFGTNTWIGHVYNHTDGPPPGGSTSPTSPSTTTSPFTAVNYVGYYNINTETINENFGGSSNCFNVLSDGVNRTNIYTELFSVRYRMKSTRPAGCYFLNVSGDDGVRVYVDNVLVFDQWKQQGTTYYCNNLIYLNGNSDIVLDYYEHQGGNVVGFSLTPFDGSANVITSSSDVQVCSGSSPGLIDGAAFGNCTGGNNGGTNTIYQWQVSTDNVTFADISGANTEDYTPPTVTTTTTNVIRYYRRSLKAFATNASSCVFYSSSVKVTTNPSTKTFTTAPTSSTCSNTDVTYTTQSGMTNYVWSVPGTLNTDYTITSGSIGTTSNTVTLKWLTSGSKTVTVNYASSCSGTIPASNTTTVELLPNNVSSGFSATTICTGDTPKITFDADDTGFVGPYIITYKNNSSPTIYTVTIPTAAATSFTPGDNPTTNTTYTLLSIANATCTRTSGFGSAGANLIVRALPTATISGTTTVCQGASSPNITFTNPQTAVITVTYNINGGTSATVDVTPSLSTIVTAPTTASGTYTYNLTKVEYKSLSTCSSVITGSNAVITVNSLSVTPTTISGTTTFCAGSSTTLTVSGGTLGTGADAKWYTGSCGGTLVGSGTSITVSPTANTTYYVRYEGSCNTTSCISKAIVVTPNASVGSVTGTSPLCVGSTAPYQANSVVLGGGTGAWSSDNTSAATVSSTGVVTGVASGTANIIYSVSGGCGATASAQKTVTISPSASIGSVSGSNSICIAGNATYTAISVVLSGGTGAWSSSNITVASVSGGGSVKGESAGTATITYTITGGCGGTVSASQVITVNAPSSVVSVSGASPICFGSTTTYTANSVVLSGGTGSWTSSNTAIATVDSVTGVVTAVTPGTALIIYSISGGCGSAQAQQSVIVNAATAAPTGSANQSFCNSSPTVASLSATGTAIKWYSVATGGTALATTVALSNGTHYYASQTISGCEGTNRLDVSVTVGSVSAPTIGTVTNIDCVNPTGSVVLNGLPTGNWTINPGAITGTGTSYTITGLTAGSYTYTVTNASGCISPATTTGGIVITNNAAVTWNGSTWSNGTGPTSSSNIIFDGNYSSSADLVGCSCQVNTGKTVVFNSGNTLKVTNQVVVTGTGMLTFENKASLVQVNDAAVNSGNIIYKRITSAVSNFDYTYWSSPVKNQKLIDVSPTTLGDKFLSFDSSSNNWKYEDAYNTTMVAGKGYIIRGPQENYAPAPPSSYEASFKGEPINGVISVAIGGTRVSNLIGNPYPSALNADAFLIANNSVLSGTLYFWTHNTSIQLASNITNGTAGSGSYAYTSDDYASYNLTGGTGTRASSSGPNTSIPDGQIAAGQGFFGTSIAPGTAIFNNAMRLKAGAIIDNSKFFRPASTSKTTVDVEKNRLWLNLVNDQGAFKQTLVGYITGATNEYESAYDGSSFNANAYINFYSLLSTSAMAIQGRALPFDENDTVPLGYKSNIAGDFKIAIDQVDGLFTSQVVYLEDKLLNVIHNLKESPYAFTTEIGVFNERFAILYANKTLGTDDFDTLNNTVFVATNNKEITITASVELIDKVYVYDFSGRQLYSKAAIDSNILVVNNLTNANVALIIKVVLNNGEMITRKIAY